MKEFLKQLPLTTLIIGYLFLCGGFYIYGFWSTFNLNPTNFLELGDIPKGFVYPLVKNQFYFLIAFTAASIWGFFSPSKTLSTSSIKNLEGDTKKKKFDWGLYLPFIMLGIIMLYSYFTEDFVFMRFAFALALIMALGILSIRIPGFYTKFFPSPLIGFSTLFSMLVVIAICFRTGDEESDRIMKNKNVKLVRMTSGGDTTSIIKEKRKLVGFLGEKIVISTLDNKQIFMINQSSYDRLELIDYTEFEEEPKQSTTPAPSTKDSISTDSNTLNPKDTINQQSPEKSNLNT